MFSLKFFGSSYELIKVKILSFLFLGKLDLDEREFVWEGESLGGVEN